MAAKGINTIHFLEKLQGLNKPYFTVSDFEKIFDMDKDTLYVTLNRLQKKGVITSLKRNVYRVAFQEMEIERVANELYYPSYLSFESALARYGIISQSPYTVTFATIKRTKTLTLGNTEVSFRQLQRSLFFGFDLQNGIYLAEPEKAILDELYLISRGLVIDNTREWSLLNLDRKRLLDYAKRFPVPVQKKVRKLLERFGNPYIGIDE